MLGWHTITIYADESETALKADFVRLSAIYPDRSPFEIGEYIFRTLREPSRGQQAASIWSKDLEILEAIRLYRLNGGVVSEGESDKERRIRILRSIADDTAEDAKDRIAALRLIAEVQGEIIKAIDKKTTGKAASGLPAYNVVRRSEALKALPSG